jgi:hypothetical protein
MKKKKTRPSSKIKVNPLEKNKKESINAAKAKDFGGIPDIDPKNLLGCG